MGYTTDFRGEFKLNKPLTLAQAKYINKFSNTRRMKRNPKIAETMADPIREAVGLPIGKESAYFTGGLGFAGQDSDRSVIDQNNPPAGQPGLWCQWIVDPDNCNCGDNDPVNFDTIGWDNGEKFYYYVEWIEYIIKHFLKPWGYTLNGTVKWRGEDFEDMGKIVITNNKVKTEDI